MILIHKNPLFGTIPEGIDIDKSYNFVSIPETYKLEMSDPLSLETTNGALINFRCICVYENERRERATPYFSILIPHEKFIEVHRFISNPQSTNHLDFNFTQGFRTFLKKLCLKQIDFSTMKGGEKEKYIQLLNAPIFDGGEDFEPWSHQEWLYTQS